jgi:hypothetical protein
VRNLKQRVQGSGLRSWEKSERTGPPPAIVKRQIVAAYGAGFVIETLIETGTWYGDMIYAMKDRFRTIFSVELSEDLCNLAKSRFRRFPHIHIMHGDSGDVLPQILADLSAPSLFWLDGHYSGFVTAKGAIDTPIRKELQAVLAHKIKDHVILIDDARCFDGTCDYPTVDELRELISVHRPGYGFSVLNDVIRIHPNPDFKSQY